MTNAMLTSTTFTQSELRSLSSAIIRNPLTISPDTMVIDAISMMSTKHSVCTTIRTESDQLEVMQLEAKSSCVIVLRDEKLVGILTERDIVRLTAQKRSLDDLLVRDVMTYPVVTLNESTFPNLFFVANLLQKYRIRHIPILSEQNHLVGLLTHESIRQITSHEDILRSRTVSEVMTREVIWATADSSMLAITQLMFEHHISSVIIVQSDRQAETRQIPIGIVTERDIVQFQGLGLNLGAYLAQDVMSTPIITVSHEDSLWTVHRSMEEKFVHRLAVTNEQGELLGIITRSSLFQVLNPLELHKQAEVLEQKVIQLESEKMQLLTNRNLELERQVEARTFELQEKVKREKLLAELSIQIRSSLSLQTILDTTVERVRQLLKCDRVNIIQLESDQNIIVAESTDSYLSTLGQVVNGIDTNQFRQVGCDAKCLRCAVGDIHATIMSAYGHTIIDKLQIRAQILVPILYADELWGFLSLTESEKSREWEEEEIKLLESLSVHLAIALHQVTINQKLQERLNECQLAEMRLRQSEAQSRAILATIPDIMVRVGADGIYRDYVTPYQDFGLLAKDSNIAGMAVKDVLPPDIAEQQLHYLHKALETGELQIYEQQLQVRDRLQDEEVRVLKYGDDEVLFMIRNISDRKKAERELHQLNQDLESKVEQRTKELKHTNQELARVTRLKDEFLANMSHELRTPLNAILGMTDGLKEHFFGTVNEQQIAALQIIESSGSHLLELIDDILDLAKIESGQIELDMISIPVNHLCQASLTFIKQQALQKRIQLEFKFQFNLPNILVDERRIRQVLINLLNNAVKFTPEGGHIRLEASLLNNELTDDLKPHQYLRIAVIDTGIGILPENIHKLFQPFMQIDSSLNREYNGTGLGLALVKRIVEMHGGMVGLTSEVDIGSTFTIDLPYIPICPLIDEKQDDNLAAETFSIDANIVDNSLILLVEDNAANISMFSQCLKTKGYHFLVAKDGQEAIDYARLHKPDLILMDIQMPKVDGIEAIKEIRADPHLMDTPIVAITALVMAGDRDRCLEAGANEYLAKPVKIKQLEITIQQFLGNQKINS